jgi:hypothetical protein
MLNTELYALHPETGEILFIGDLEAGKRIAEQNCGVHADYLPYQIEPGQSIDDAHGGFHYVHLCDDTTPHWGDVDEYGMCGRVAEWGHSRNSMDEAWQYALASLFGPLDDDYDEFVLKQLLELAS